MRASDAVRFAYGLALLVDPERAGRVMTGARLDRRARITARVLGARHVAQAVVLAVDDRALDLPLAEGNIYVVSGPAMQDVGLDLPPHRPA